MFEWQAEIKDRIETYCHRSQRSLAKQIGFGYDGLVFETNQKSAVKGLKHQQLHRQERDVYLRLAEYDMTVVRDCQIPTMLGRDDELWVVEMEIVSPPFVLDFAGAYLDFPPEYPDDVLAAWRTEKREQYGEDWPWVQDIMRDLASIGIYLADVKPGNITLR